MRGFSLVVVLLVLLSIANVSALSVVVHVPEKYTDVYAGERFYFEIDVKYPENTARKDLRLKYEILKDGEVLAQSNVLKAIETQSSFIDFIVIPESAKEGLYDIKVIISDYENLSEEVSASFHVINDEAGQIRFYFFLLLGAVILVGGLIVWEIHRLSRRK